MQIINYPDFVNSLQKLKVAGGRDEKIAKKVESIIGNLVTNKNFSKELKLTKYGENRIEHCVKYDLGNGYRLVTIHHDKYILLCFTGDHESCEKWIESHRGCKLIIDKKNKLDFVHISSNIQEQNARVYTDSNLSDEPLIKKLPQDVIDKILQGLAPTLIFEIYKLNSFVDENSLRDICINITDNERSKMLYDVLMFLRGDDVEQALKRIDFYFKNSRAIDELSEEEFINIKDGDKLKKIPVGSDEYLRYLKKLIDSANYKDWMLFMHSEQQKVVDADVNGSSKLSGVSGSGKTCIVVKRAIRLAQKLNGKKVLVLTLNKSLKLLIKELIEYACHDDKLLINIEVLSFFELCQKLLFKFEPENKKIYTDVTWKSKEHIDEIWREYYRCELNNNDAEVLLPLHISLNSQGYNPEEYIRQEFDWIRSVLSEDEYAKYLTIDRKGRCIPLMRDYREKIIRGLEKWNEKMRFVGVTDYLGLSTQLYKHINKITPDYGAILVDEVQDFGTLELKIIRKLVSEGENDLFLCGDMAQHVFPKHQNFKEAGIKIAKSFVIKKNYRNSKEILKAAYEVLIRWLDNEMIVESDIEILDPEYANVSLIKPYVLKANNLVEEINYSYNLILHRIRNSENKDYKGCIVIAGFSLLELQKYAPKLSLPVLDGTRGITKGNLFISDLEQTKGFEFDIVCILNCNQGIVPSNLIPDDERYRDVFKLYVAMTRAKKELIISYSEKISECFDFEKANNLFIYDKWENYISNIDMKKLKIDKSPEHIPEFVDKEINDIGELTGKQFIYTKHAIGFSVNLQEKLISLINGRRVIENYRIKSWKNIRSAYNDVSNSRDAKRAFGPVVSEEFLQQLHYLFGNQ